MPRYFFNLRDTFTADDPEGLELASLDAAIEGARRFAIDLAAASVAESRELDLRHRIEIADETGTVLHVMRFGDVVKVIGQSD